MRISIERISTKNTLTFSVNKATTYWRCISEPPYINQYEFTLFVFKFWNCFSFTTKCTVCILICYKKKSNKLHILKKNKVIYFQTRFFIHWAKWFRREYSKDLKWIFDEWMHKKNDFFFSKCNMSKLAKANTIFRFVRYTFSLKLSNFPHSSH